MTGQDRAGTHGIGREPGQAATRGGRAKGAETQTLTLESSPPGHHRLTQSKPLEGDLITAITAIWSGVNEAERAEPRFILECATVEVAVTVTTEGEILILTSGVSGRTEDTPSVRRTLNRPQLP